MLTLHHYAPVPGQDSLSSFCTKAHRMLRYKGLDYEVKEWLTAKQVLALHPSGKLPLLDTPQGRLQDSSRIARWVDTHHPERPLFPTDPHLRHETHLLEDWADEGLYWFLVYCRWTIDDHYALFLDEVFASVPSFMRRPVGAIFRRRLLRDLHSQGLGRHPTDDVLEQLGRHLDMISHRVGPQGWLVGDHLTIADVAVFAVLQGMDTPMMPLLTPAFEARPAVRAWMLRVDAATQAQAVP